jgi:uncharacterized SAM-dependent methyltransferase
MTAPVAIPRMKPLAIDVLLTEQQIAADFTAALAQGFLDERFFYWLPLSAAAWMELCAATQYRNSLRATEVLTRSAPLLARLWPSADTLCGLGCGDASKDRWLLEAFAERHPLFYVGADFSQPLLEAALQCAGPAASAVRGFKLDLLSDDHLAVLAASIHDAGKSCIYSVLGNTLGAFGPAEFPVRLRRCMRPDDRVIFDGEIFAGEETLAGYDNPQNRQFAFAPLAALGVAEQDGELRFEVRPGKDGLYEVSKHFVPARDLDLNLGAKTVRLPAGQKLRMSGSIKYDSDALVEAVTRAGFRIEFSQASEDGRFVLLAAAPE